MVMVIATAMWGATPGHHLLASTITLATRSSPRLFPGRLAPLTLPCPSVSAHTHTDHGYKLGQWGVATSKMHPFETDIRVPLLMRGPGIAAGTVLPQLAGNVDIAPTVLFLAGGQGVIPRSMDGRNMAPFLLPGLHQAAVAAASNSGDVGRQGAAGTAVGWREQFLVEYKSVGTFWADHTATWSPSDGSVQRHCGSPGPPRSPAGLHPKQCVEEDCVGCGTCYFLDSIISNSWRQLRIINSEEDIAYIE